MSERRDNIDSEFMRNIEHLCREMGRDIDRTLNPNGHPKKIGFALLIFGFEGPEMTYVSNAQRGDMVKCMQEFITRNPPPVTSEGRN